MPKTETLIWPSPSDESFIYAKIDTDIDQTDYSTSGGDTPTVQPVSYCKTLEE